MNYRIILLALMVSLSACKTARKAADETPSDVPTVNTAVEEEALGDSDSGKAYGLKTIRFPYDSFALSAEAKSDIQANAKILKDRASAKVQIEGHCDQRGGIQYNIALGEKRANAVKLALVAQGVAENRISTISYGKERLLDSATTEAAYAQNRRANFVVTSK